MSASSLTASPITRATLKRRAGRIGGGETDFHVLAIPVSADRREARIAHERLLVVGLLQRAFLRLLLRRVNRMHRDPAWAAARELSKGAPERAAAFKALRVKHDLALTQMAASEQCKTLWRGASRQRTREFNEAKQISDELARCLGRKPRKDHAPLGWMPQVISARIAGAVGKEVWKSVDEYLYGKRGRPHPQNPRERKTAWNEDNTSGMFLDGDHLVWKQAGGSGRKDLCLRLQKRQGSAWWAKRLEGKRVLAVGITEDAGVFYALLRVAGRPYRDPEYLASVKYGEWVGMDPAPTNPGFVSADDGFVGTLATESAKGCQLEFDRKIRRLQRAQDRSRRAMNPDCFDERGRAIRGKRQRNRSKAYRQRQLKLQREQRRARAQRRTEAERLTRRIMSMGTRVAAEKTSHKGWQAGGLKLGKRMHFTRPGELYARLRAETRLLAGLHADPTAAVFLELPTAKLALSQHCLCGERVKKPRSQRIHKCGSCGLGPLHRDLFSAYLARLVAESGLVPETIDLSEGLFDSPDTRAEAARLCGVSSTRLKQLPRPAALPDPVSNGRVVSAGLLACRETVSDLDLPLPQGESAELTTTAAVVVEVDGPGSERTRPLAAKPHRRGSRTTSSGGETNGPERTSAPPGALTPLAV